MRKHNKLDYLLVGGILAATCHVIKNGLEKERERWAEDERRRNTPCYFIDGLSIYDFERMAYKAGKNIKRLIAIDVDGPVIYGTVRAQSGLSTWQFKVDFNDYGHITGNYWISSENDDSNIPEYFADDIRELIKLWFINLYSDNSNNHSKRNDGTRICPRCGAVLNHQSGFASWKVAFTCKNCGQYLEWANENIYKEEQHACADDVDYTSEARTEASFINEIESPSSIKQKIKRLLIIVGVLMGLLIIAVIGYSVDYLFNGIIIETANQELVDIDYATLEKELQSKGFLFISLESVPDLEYKDVERKNTVAEIVINGDTDFSSTEKFSRFSRIKIIYHTMQKVKAPISANDAEGRQCEEVVSLFKDAGYGNIEVEADYDIIFGLFDSAGETEKISIDGYDDFSEGSLFGIDAPIHIIYHEK